MKLRVPNNIPTSLLGDSSEGSHNLSQFSNLKFTKHYKGIVRIWLEGGGRKVVECLVAWNGDVAASCLLIHPANWGIHQNIIHYKLFTPRWRPHNYNGISLYNRGNCYIGGRLRTCGDEQSMIYCYFLNYSSHIYSLLNLPDGSVCTVTLASALKRTGLE